MRSFMICFSYQIYSSDRIKKNALDVTCVACGEQESCLEDQGVDRRIILRWNSRKRIGERPE
jgi:hypothetical protein